MTNRFDILAEKENNILKRLVLELRSLAYNEGRVDFMLEQIQAKIAVNKSINRYKNKLSRKEKL